MSNVDLSTRNTNLQRLSTRKRRTRSRRTRHEQSGLINHQDVEIIDEEAADQAKPGSP